MINAISNPNRIIALMMAMIIPFCCCTLDLCAQSSDVDAPASCCCNTTENSCPSDEQVPVGTCSGCIKAPATAAPNLDIDSLSQLPVLHPAEIVISHTGFSPINAELQFNWRLSDHSGSNPGSSARALRRQITPQV